MSAFKHQAWITTNACTYRPANITPSYTGYIPQQRFKYGDTFANTTAECFQARKNTMVLSSVLNSHKEISPPVVKFPTVFSNDPKLVLAHRKRSRERWLAAQKYQLKGEGTKEGQLQGFLQECQRHREYYHDYTGTVGRVEAFVLPKLAAQQTSAADTVVNPTSNFINSNSSCKSMADVSTAVTVTDYIKKRYDQKVPRFRGYARQRAIRDQVFENR